MFIGTELNESEDAWKLGDFSDRWINVYLSHRCGTLPSKVERSMVEDMGGLLNEHLSHLREGQPWGWKEPRSIYLLPFLHEHLPALRFLHVVRDGRDMALSPNQNQLRKHGDAAPIPTGLSPRARSIALWSWVNLAAARYGEEGMGDRYLRLRFEDLCAKPVEVTRKLLVFLGLDGDPAAALEEVAPPSSLGRWRDEAPDVVAELERLGGPALRELGYEPAVTDVAAG